MSVAISRLGAFMQQDTKLETSLEEWFARASDATDMGYPCIRCAGLQRILYALLLKDQPDLAAKAAGRLNTLLVAALYIRGGGHLDNPDAARDVPREIMQWADAYAGRMDRAMAQSGQIFSGDELVKSDILQCDPVAQYAADLLQKRP
jgi:hypothetical protein